MKKILILAAALALPLGAQAVSMPGMCNKEIGPDAAKVCADPAVSEGEGLLFALYKASIEKMQGDSSKALQEDQRKWWEQTKGCAKQEAMSQCLHNAYADRALALQSKYKVVKATGPVNFNCADGSKVKATFLDMTPAMMVAQRGEQRLMLRGQKAASGTLYTSREEQFREHQGKVTIKWGLDAKEVSCKKG